MKRGMWFMVMAFGVALALSSPALANEKTGEYGMMGGCGMTGMHGKMWSNMTLADKFSHKASLILTNASQLGLTDDQVEKIKTLQYNTEKSRIKNQADIDSLALDIKEGLGKDTVDVNAINGLLDKKYAAKAQQAKDTVAAYANLKNILTKEQLDKLKSIAKTGMTASEGMGMKVSMMKGMRKEMMGGNR